MEFAGMDVGELPEGWVPIEAIIIIKAMRDDGYEQIVCLETQPLSMHEGVGMLDVALSIRRALILNASLRRPTQEGS